MTTTMMRSVPSENDASQALCSICEIQPYTLICKCGAKFDYLCVSQHVEHIGIEIEEQYQQVASKLKQIDELQEKGNNGFDGSIAVIDNWRRKRIEDINSIADRVINNIEQRENMFGDILSLQHSFDQIKAEKRNIVHETLDALHALNRQLQNKLDNCRDLTVSISNEADLDAELQAKLNPSTLTANHNGPTHSFSSSPLTNTNQYLINNIEYSPSHSEFRRTEPVTSTRISLHNESYASTLKSSHNVRVESAPSPSLYSERVEQSTSKSTMPEISKDDNVNDDVNHDEFDAGHTHHIQRTNPIIIPVNNDKFVATLCSYNTELLYNDYDRTRQEYRLILIQDINNPTHKTTIPWNARTTMINDSEDAWIQDIVYCGKLGHYLLLNRGRLLSLIEAERHDYILDTFYEFTGYSMKRLACNEQFIFVTCSRTIAGNNGDEIILLNYQKEQQVSKTFRDIIPSRINRGSGPLPGEISDIATGGNEQVIIGYRFDRRKEIGICLYNITNDGHTWSFVKQLLLNECWHDDLSYTPRLDWSAQLKNFILIEYMTGHLIMIDRNGQVEGECRFMQAENRRESPINLAISNNGLLCVRYESSITIHKLS